MNPRALAELLVGRSPGRPARHQGRGRRARASSTSGSRRRSCTRCCAPPSSTARASAGAGRARAPPSTWNTSRPIPTGPMHVGHGRGAVFGDALAGAARLRGLRGHPRVLHQRCRRAGRRSRPLRLPALPGGAGPGDRRDPGRALSGRLPEARRRARSPGSMAASLLDKPEAEWLPLVREASIDAMMDMIRDDLAALNIHHDVFFSERSLQQGNGGEVAKTDRRICRPATWSIWAACRRPRARRTRIGRTGSSCCSAPPPSATRSTGRC